MDLFLTACQYYYCQRVADVLGHSCIIIARFATNSSTDTRRIERIQTHYCWPPVVFLVQM